VEVAGEFEKVVIRIYKDCFISSLKQVTAPVPFYVEIGGIGAIEGMHEGTEIRFRGFHKEMIVVCHENESMDKHAILINCLCKIRKELFIIRMG
jgi:hypothetical protein